MTKRKQLANKFGFLITELIMPFFTQNGFKTLHIHLM